MKILYCDDDLRMLDLVAQFFLIAGHEIDTTDTAFGLSRRVTTWKPDVLLLDYRMPALSGDNFLEIFQKSPSGNSTPVIFYSAEDPQRLAVIAQRYSVLGWIPKTTMGRSLVNEVERLYQARTTEPTNARRLAENG